MHTLRGYIRDMRIRFGNLFKKSEDMHSAKSKWNRLAREDARFYIYTDKEVAASEESFRHSGDRDVREHLLEDPLLRPLLGAAQKPAVLEIGCGIGRLSEFIAPHASRFVGVDISEEMIERAKARLGHFPHASFSSTDGMHYPLAEASVDLVFSFIVFQHMPTVEVIRTNIEEIARVLKPGGMAKLQLRGIPVSKEHWYYGPSFNRTGVEDLLRGTGLSLHRLEGEGQKYFWLWLKNSNGA